MTFEIDVDGRMHRVALQPDGAADAAGGRFTVTVDDEASLVEARRTELGLMLRFPDGRTLDVALTPRSGGEWFVQLPHVGVTATVDGRRSAGAGGTADDAGTGPQRIAAPMPGRVVRVLVKPGEAVAARQGLVVVEAMKMENELSAARAGTVKEIAVAEGASVEAGRLLVVVD
jgi:biotin carboxyl carrier protein